jgi:predicted phosphodiesterase
MKIRLLSDLHHEFYEDKGLYGSKGEDVLVIAGDLAVGAMSVYWALQKFNSPDRPIVYVSGNHEYYRGNIVGVSEEIRILSEDLNVYFLNPGSVIIGDVTFIGGTLWTNFRNNLFSGMACRSAVSDFSMIERFTPDKCANLYEEHIKYIKDAYNAYSGKKVIVTHFLPAVECIAEQYQGDSVLNDYFANDLGEYISYLQDTTWLFGHTHDNVDKLIGDTRCIANPYGYNLNSGYKECIIEI